MMTDGTKMKSTFGVRKNIVEIKDNLPIHKTYMPQIALAYMKDTHLISAFIWTAFEISVKSSSKYALRYLLLKKISYIWSLNF